MTTRTISPPRRKGAKDAKGETCSVCRGTGSKNWFGGNYLCGKCQGTGRVGDSPPRRKGAKDAKTLNRHVVKSSRRAGSRGFILRECAEILDRMAHVLRTEAFCCDAEKATRTISPPRRQGAKTHEGRGVILRECAARLGEAISHDQLAQRLNAVTALQQELQTEAEKANPEIFLCDDGLENRASQPGNAPPIPGKTPGTKKLATARRSGLHGATQNAKRKTTDARG